MDWSLTSSQVANWIDHWARQPHRAQSELAEKLSKIPVKSRRDGGEKKPKAADSWKPDLSNFFKGEAKALGRVLGDDRICDAVARHVGLGDAATLRAVHARMRGEVANGPLDVRIPGFEDYGPVPAVDVYLPPLGGGQGGIVIDGEPVALHPPGLDQLVRACTGGEDPHSIAVEGGIRSGKTTLLRALSASLDRAGIPWGTTPTDDAAVVVVDDWDQTPRECQRLVKEWLRPGRTAVTARVGRPREGELAASHATIILSPLMPHWLHGYVDRIKQVLLSRWSVPFEVDALHDWLDDDALASELVRNFRSLGLVLRATAEGRWPAPVGDRPRLLLRQLLTLVRQGPERLFLEDFGPDVLRTLASRLVSSPGGTVSRREIAILMAEIAAPLRARAALDDAGIFRPVDALLSAGPFRVTEGTVTCDSPPFLLPAMRDDWQAHLAEVFTLPDAAHVAEAAAVQFGDPVLRAALELDPGHLISAIPTITRILRSDAPYSDGVLWTRAFRMCATWWAHAPKNPGAAGTPPPPATERFDAVSPSLLLAQAAVKHASLLPGVLSPLSVATDLPSALRRWLAIHSVGPAEGTNLDAVLRFVAPSHAGRFPAVPDMRTAVNWGDTEVPGLAPQDWERWWRTVLVPLWRKHPLGEGFIAGTVDGSSPTWGGSQNTDGGLKIWTGALMARIAAGDPAAVSTTCRAIVFAFERGGSRLHTALVACARHWTRIRTALRGELLAAMTSLRPATWWESKEAFGTGESLLSVVLDRVLLPDQVDALWSAWATVKADSVPWRAFVNAGISRAAVVEWALNRGAQGLKPVADESLVHALHNRPSKYRKSLRLELIEELANSGDVGAAIAIFAGPTPHETRWRLRTSIDALGPIDFRRERIEAALTAGTIYRGPLIENLLPTEDDADLWARIVLSCPTVAERLGRVAQWCAGQVGADRWEPFVEILDATEAEWASLPGHIDDRTLTQAQDFQMYGGTWISRQVARKDLPGPEDRHEVVRRLLGSPTWAPSFLGWDSGGLWALALQILPADQFRGLLVRDLRSPWGHDSRPARLGALMVGGQFELVVSLLSDPELGPAAASVLSGLRFGDVGWPLTKLAELISTRPFQVDGLIDQLTILALRHQPSQAVEWVAERLRGLPVEVAVRWWEILLPTMPVCPARSRALGLYFRLAELGIGSD